MVFPSQRANYAEMFLYDNAIMGQGISPSSGLRHVAHLTFIDIELNIDSHNGLVPNRSAWLSPKLAEGLVKTDNMITPISAYHDCLQLFPVNTALEPCLS